MTKSIVRLISPVLVWAVLAVSARGETPRLELSAEDFRIEGELGTFAASQELEVLDEGLAVLHLELEAPAAAVPPEMTLRFRVPSLDVHAYWNPGVKIDKVNYWSNSVDSRAARHAPVLALIDNADRNRLTFALSDALNKVEMRTHVKEEDAFFECYVRLFSERTPARRRYTADLRLDTRALHYAEALGQVADWWTSYEGYEPAPVPDAARWPMYSTWYSFHQRLDAGEVMAELEIARQLGYEAVIVDDGWQTLDSNRGYAYTGDWQPERLTELGGLVERVHGLDMDFLLWYSLPFMGEKAKNFERFQGRFLRYWESQDTYVLDPRYPEVREFIISTYEDADAAWNVDGFKLDFIDRFLPAETTPLSAEDGRDLASVDEAVDRLMTDVMARLREKRPDVLIEFRQRYTGPLMRKYGNMFRAVDCPNNAVANRVETTDLRLLSGATAVHADMLMWHGDDPVEDAALQILNVLFSVPQLSVRLTRLAPEHHEMIGFWTRYWRRNRGALLDGTFRPKSPGALYPLIRAEDAKKRIVAVYEDMVVDLDGLGGRDLDLVNGKRSPWLVVRSPRPLGDVLVTSYDTRGSVVARSERQLGAGLHELAVPASGLVTLERLPRSALVDPRHELWSRPAPESFQVSFETSQGEFAVEVHREWAPRGVDRFYRLVAAGFFDDSRFFRVREGFIAQFGIPGDPAVTAVWKDRTIADDPVRRSNVRGTFAFAMTGPDTRTTQLYVNLAENSRLDEQGFAPLGRVIRGMDVVDRLYSGYGEEAGGGMRGGRQGKMLDAGNGHLDAAYPRLDRLIRASLEPEPGSGGDGR